MLNRIGDHGAEQHHGFAAELLPQDFGGCGHRVRAVGNDDVAGVTRLAAFEDVRPVLVGHFQTVFQEQGVDRHIERAAPSGKHDGQAGLLERHHAIAFIVNFIQRAAGDE